MKKKSILLAAVLSMTLFSLFSTTNPKANTTSAETETISEDAAEDSENTLVYDPENPMTSYQLQGFLSTNKEKTFIIPSGTTLYVTQVIDIGDNTTIIADGATICQTADGKGVLKHIVDGGKYNSIKNITIIGGTWKNQKNTSGCTMFRFAHGKNLKFQNVDIRSNYQGHGLELIACKNVIVENCTIIAENEKTKSFSVHEEALQIDVASPLTSPGILREGGKKSYVAGQTCQNITVKDCTISGARGICANFTHNEQYMNRIHKNITITGCTVTAYTAEAITLFNTVNCTVKNNTVKTYSKDKANSYSCGIHLLFMKKLKNVTKYKDIISGNKVYGNYAGIEVSSKLRSTRGPVTITNNTVYCKQGKDRCIRAFFCKKTTTSKNKIKKW